ncbi:MAG: DUF4876 domain-containing protein [Massilibacteroides sp.]|nr:DUF4876 domain-containing protein [Massilibacteroides sp.]MDD3062500.1 DUF4876 domain-containing protein [Massilibacteroides sp.]MDD4114435.1 DUF4876 domain-containing protein [Massilibacteroides sp.]MDD4660354.1 DUF4876 domain-containing protein [Massilibacteroides sp.]
MYKKTFYLLSLFTLLFVTSCSDDDDDVAKNYEVSIELVTPESIALDKISDLKVVAVNVTTGSETTLSLTDGTVKTELTAGEYNFRASGNTDDFKLNGLINASVYENKVVRLTLNIVSGNGLIFKEVYYTGVMAYYWKDGFYEIYNNSNEVQYLDGVILGIVDGGFGAPSPWADEDGNLPERYPMINHTVYFPGSGQEYPLEPGKSVIVATVAINHSARELTDEDTASPVDLSNADWNIYIPTQASDIQVSGIPNTLVAYSTWGLDFMPRVNGQALILAKLPEGTTVESFVANPDNYQKTPGTGLWNQLMIPHEYVIDGVDFVYPMEGQQYKTLLATEDVGMTWVYGNDGPGTEASYSGKSIRRKVAGITEDGMVIYKDTNNSSEDFILGGQTPTPGVHPTTIDD